MRAKEFITEAELDEIDRRGFIRALGAGAGAAALASIAPIAKAGQYTPVANLSQAGLTRWKEEAAKLYPRLVSVYKQILLSNPTAKIIPHRLLVRDCSGVAAHNVNSHEITFDPTVFYDISDDGIAYTMGHELSHCLLGHMGNFNKIAAGFYPASSRQREIDADVLGAELAFRAKYDPSKAFESFSNKSKNWKGSWLASHPDFSERQGPINNKIDQLKATAANPIREEDQTSLPNSEKTKDLQDNMLAIQKWLQFKKA